MARHLKVVETPKTEDDKASPGVGHNTGHKLPMSADIYNAAKHYIDRVSAEADAEAAKLKPLEARVGEKKAEIAKARKMAQAQGISLEEFDFARRLAGLKNPNEARAIILRLWTYIGYEGIQLPDVAVDKDPYAGIPDIERDRMIWREKGYLAATSGKGVFRSERPEGCPVEMFQYWVEGVDAGQEAIAMSLRNVGPLFDPDNAPKDAAPAAEPTPLEEAIEAKGAADAPAESPQPEGEGGESDDDEEDLRPDFLKEKTEAREEAEDVHADDEAAEKAEDDDDAPIEDEEPVSEDDDVDGDAAAGSDEVVN